MLQPAALTPCPTLTPSPALVPPGTCQAAEAVALFFHLPSCNPVYLFVGRKERKDEEENSCPWFLPEQDRSGTCEEWGDGKCRLMVFSWASLAPESPALHALWLVPDCPLPSPVLSLAEQLSLCCCCLGCCITLLLSLGGHTTGHAQRVPCGQPPPPQQQHQPAAAASALGAPLGALSGGRVHARSRAAPRRSLPRVASASSGPAAAPAVAGAAAPAAGREQPLGEAPSW